MDVYTIWCGLVKTLVVFGLWIEFHNYMWLYNHMMVLGLEYTKRYSKQHLTITKLGDILKTPTKERTL